MDKKTKLMAICAAGAAAILIGAGLARCAIAPAEPEPEPVVAVEEESGQGAQADDPLSGYLGTVWTSEDGSATLSLSDSTIVEQGDAGTQVMY